MHGWAGRVLPQAEAEQGPFTHRLTPACRLSCDAIQLCYAMLYHGLYACLHAIVVPYRRSRASKMKWTRCRDNLDADDEPIAVGSRMPRRWHAGE